jgi:hypothetical protein
MQQLTPLTPDHPAMVREACAAHLRRTAALAPGADYLAPRRVDDAEDRRAAKQTAASRDTSVQTQEPGPRGRRGNNARASRVTQREQARLHARAGMQQSQGDHLTGPEVYQEVWRWRPSAHRL